MLCVLYIMYKLQITRDMSVDVEGEEIVLDIRKRARKL